MGKLSAFLLALTTTCSPAVLGQPQAADDRPGDAELTARVKAALVDDETTNARQVNVETRNGVVQLSGFVDSEEMSEAALTAAKSVRGVNEVRNDLVVRKDDRTAGRAVDDTVIAAKVRTELSKRAQLGSDSDVDVEVNNGVVQLSGFVTTAEEKTRAADIASNVDGVKDVHNSIALGR
jgi:hyperosmotically inducible protein